MESLIRYLFLVLYYVFAYHLPSSYSKYGGGLYNWMRIYCVKHIFKKCGKISTIDKRAYFGNGCDIEIGNESGIGANNHLPNNIKIGSYVMMAADIYIIGNSENHEYLRTDIPMCHQGKRQPRKTIIEDDCWIGARVIMTSGRKVAKGSIIAAGAVLTKNFDEYSIVGGNPAKLIKKRI